MDFTDFGISVWFVGLFLDMITGLTGYCPLLVVYCRLQADFIEIEIEFEFANGPGTSIRSPGCIMDSNMGEKFFAPTPLARYPAR